MANVTADQIENVIDEAETTSDVSELKVLGKGKTEYDGDLVLSGQEQTKTFTHVSKIWSDQCISYEQGMNLLADQQANILDLKKPLSDFSPVVTDDGKFAIRYLPTGKDYFPTENAIQHLVSVVPKDKGSTWEAKRLMGADASITTQKGEDKTLWKRDRRDSELLRQMIDLLVFQADRVDQKKIRLFRTWDNDSTLRAVLSKDYTIVNNQWMLETVSKLIPGGLLSHWRGDADEIFGNVLIPDTIRAEEDSDYGGMLSIGNSEIGTRRISSCPSVFRAICMNGCIWDHELGKGISQVHRRKDGKMDLDSLANSIKVNLEKQIPLVESGIRKMLAVKDYGFDSVEPIKVLAATIQKLRISKKLAKGIKQMYRIESDIVGDSAFTIMQAITRYGQTLPNLQWVDFDIKGGTIAKMNRKQWENLVANAATLEDKDLEKIGVA